MDNQVGDILKVLKNTGKSEETLVILLLNKVQFPGCKWTNWDTGLHAAFIARWLGVIKVGLRLMPQFSIPMCCLHLRPQWI